MVNKTDKYLSPTEAALLLNTSANSLRYSEKFKIIPVYKNPVYGTRMYKREDLEKFLNTEVIPLRYEAYETKKRNAAIEKTTEKIIEKPITINKEEIIRAKNIEAQIAEKVQVIEKLEEISKIPTEEEKEFIIKEKFTYSLSTSMTRTEKELLMDLVRFISKKERIEISMAFVIRRLIYLGNRYKNEI